MKLKFTLFAFLCLCFSSAFAQVSKYDLEPEQGEVSELPYIEVDFWCEDIERLDSESFHVNYNGNFYCALKSSIPFYQNLALMRLTPALPCTAAGEYEFVIPKGSMSFYDAQYNESELTDDLVFTYTIKGAPDAAKFDLTITSNPAAGSTVDLASAGFSGFTFTLSATDAALATDASLTLKNAAGTVVQTVTPVSKGNGVFDVPFTTPAANGNYTVAVDRGYFGNAAYVESNGATGSANEAVILNYTFANVPMAPVVYDLEVNYTKPANGATVNVQSTQFESVIVYMKRNDLDCLPGAVATLRSTDGTYEKTSTFKHQFGSNFIAFFNEPDFNGEYEFIVPAGTIGDADFISSGGKTGHANPELVSKLTFEGLKEMTPVVYTANISAISPKAGEVNLTDNDMTELTITLPSGIEAPGNGFTATVYAPDGTVYATPAFSTTFGTTYNATMPAPVYNGDYTLVIPQGSFGDNTWYFHPNYGVANPEIKVVWNVTGGESVGVQTVNGENAGNAPAYRPDGTKAGANAKGIVIVNGKKILNK